MTDTSTTQLRQRESGRHPVNVGHLVMGIALLGLFTTWALIAGDVVEGEDVRWLLPMPWVLAGAAGLAALAVSGRRGQETRQVGWVTPPEPAATAGPAEPAEPTEETTPFDTARPSPTQEPPIEPIDEATTDPTTPDEPTEENR
jgi:hypothetical protein